MSSSDTLSSPPIILIPTEHSNAINNEPAVLVRCQTPTNKNSSFKESGDFIINALKREIKALFTFHPKEWISAFRPNPKFPLLVLGDIDGFVALFMNNLATLLAVILGLRIVFEDDIIYGKIIPG
jgi:hypothetical protein